MTSPSPREPDAPQQALALTIGVMGGAGRDIPEGYLAKAEALAKRQPAVW